MSAIPVRALVCALTLLLAAPAAAATATPEPPRAKRLQELVSTARKLQRAKEPVRAYLYLREAYRLEQLWSGNTFGDDALSKTALERFTIDLVRAEDGGLMKILHSPNVRLNDKLNLLRVLEQEVLMHYSARPEPGE